MIVCLILHEATAIWDVSYAYGRREVAPTEQHVHSLLEMLPLMGLLIVVTLHWHQFLSLFGLGSETADFGVRLKQPPLPWLYVTAILSLVLLFDVLPYLEELFRGLRHETGAEHNAPTFTSPRTYRRPLRSTHGCGR
jgi:ABC-type spermidine/putrescine transport system permease subunit I